MSKVLRGHALAYDVVSTSHFFFYNWRTYVIAHGGLVFDAYVMYFIATTIWSIC